MWYILETEGSGNGLQHAQIIGMGANEARAMLHAVRSYNDTLNPFDSGEISEFAELLQISNACGRQLVSVKVR